jgi:hypothetical protein
MSEPETHVNDPNDKQHPSDQGSTGEFSNAFAARKTWKVDPDLWRALMAVLPDTPVRIVDIGAGVGHYVEALSLQGHKVAGVDGIPGIDQLSGGKVIEFNLTKAVGWNPPADWALCIEVGEHIPEQFESVFLDNLAAAATEGLIVSWAYPGQRGRDHINCRLEGWVIDQLGQRGWDLNGDATQTAKLAAGGGWARKLCVFQPNPTPVDF